MARHTGYFDIKIKHIAGKHLKLTDLPSRNPVSKPETTENYDDEYVIICIKPLVEFINNHGSINESKMQKRERITLKSVNRKPTNHRTATKTNLSQATVK